jgi:hypothetical protein
VLIPSALTNVTVSEGNTVTFVSSSYGSPTLHYQWWDDVFGTPLSGKTNASLTLTNVTVASNDQHGYYVVVNNDYGTAQSPSFVLTVVSGPPQVIDDVAPFTAVYAGRSFSLQINVGGTPPFTYQWQHAGTNLSDGGRFSGTHTNHLAISAAQLGDAGDYQVLIHNAQGDTPSGIGTVEVETLADFNGAGSGWVFNTFLTTGAGWLSPNVLTLTDGGTGEESAAWYQFPLYIGAFYATFTYQDIGSGGADGIAFVLQNDPRGTAAIGGTGGALGYGPDNGGSAIQPSVGLEFNIFNGHAIGYAFRTNGLTGDPYTPSTPVSVSSGNPIDVALLYVNGVVQLTLTDETTLATYNTSIPVGDIIPLVGGTNSAYVGLTGASGGTASHQTVSNFAYYPLATLSSVLTSTNTVLLYWPASIGGYSLQGNSDLTGANPWLDVTAPVTISGGYNQVIVAPGAAQFYRLKATLP